MRAHALHDILQRLRTRRRAAGRPAPRLLAGQQDPAMRRPSRNWRPPGQRAFGENYVQEAAGQAGRAGRAGAGMAPDRPPAVEQGREAAAAVRLGADRRPAPSWSPPWPRHRAADRAPLNVLIQVNIDDEASKYGCQPGRRAGAGRRHRRAAAAAPARADGDPGAASRPRAAPRRLPPHARPVRRAARAAIPHVDTLSMGMSDDFDRRHRRRRDDGAHRHGAVRGATA